MTRLAQALRAHSAHLDHLLYEHCEAERMGDRRLAGCLASSIDRTDREINRIIRAMERPRPAPLDSETVPPFVFLRAVEGGAL